MGILGNQPLDGSSSLCNIKFKTLWRQSSSTNTFIATCTSLCCNVIENLLRLWLSVHPRQPKHVPDNLKYCRNCWKKKNKNKNKNKNNNKKKNTFTARSFHQSWYIVKYWSSCSLICLTCSLRIKNMLFQLVENYGQPKVLMRLPLFFFFFKSDSG